MLEFGFGEGADGVDFLNFLQSEEVRENDSLEIAIRKDFINQVYVCERNVKTNLMDLIALLGNGGSVLEVCSECEGILAPGDSC